MREDALDGDPPENRALSVRDRKGILPAPQQMREGIPQIGCRADHRRGYPRACTAARIIRRGTIGWLLALALLIAFITAPEIFTFAFAPLTEHGAPAIYNQGSLLSLTFSHLTIVFGAALASTVIAVALGIFVTRPSGVEFLPLSRSLVNTGQTFPPIAVLAVAVPLVGFGEAPTFIALFLYGLLPIFENTLSGLTQVPPLTLEAARGMEMSPSQAPYRRGAAPRAAGHPRRHPPFDHHQSRHRHHRLHCRREGPRAK